MYTIKNNYFNSCTIYNDMGTFITLICLPSVTLITYIPTVKCCSGSEMEHAHQKREHEAIYEHQHVETHDSNNQSKQVESSFI